MARQKLRCPQIISISSHPNFRVTDRPTDHASRIQPYAHGIVAVVLYLKVSLSVIVCMYVSSVRVRASVGLNL